MVKIDNILKATSVWIAAIYVLYGNQDVEATARGSYPEVGIRFSRFPISRGRVSGVWSRRCHGDGEVRGKARKFKP